MDKHQGTKKQAKYKESERVSHFYNQINETKILSCWYSTFF